jgi:hypothetical protein
MSYGNGRWNKLLPLTNFRLMIRSTGISAGACVGWCSAVGREGEWVNRVCPSILALKNGNCVCVRHGQPDNKETRRATTDKQHYCTMTLAWRPFDPWYVPWSLSLDVQHQIPSFFVVNLILFATVGCWMPLFLQKIGIKKNRVYKWLEN